MTSTIVIANDRQMAAIMAGLRLIERELPRSAFLPQGVHEIFDAGETIAPLREAEIDDLCDSITMTDPVFVAADDFEGKVFYFNTSTGWDGNVAAAKQYSFTDLLTAHLPSGVHPRWVPISDLVNEPSAKLSRGDSPSRLNRPMRENPRSDLVQPALRAIASACCRRPAIFGLAVAPARFYGDSF